MVNSYYTTELEWETPPLAHAGTAADAVHTLRTQTHLAKAVMTHNTGKILMF